MITGDLKSKIDGLWEDFWVGGITNPLTVIEQITYANVFSDAGYSGTTRREA